MKYILLICLSLLTVLVSCNLSDEKITIAILTPVTHPSLEQIEKGFKQTMKQNGQEKFQFVTYNAQGNKSLMRSEIEEISQKGYSLVLTIGTMASQMTKEVFEKKSITIPVVFTCVNDPIGFNIVASEQVPGSNITGVKEELRFEEELAALKQHKPDIERILLVYNPAEPGLQKDQQAIAQILKEHSITLKTVEVFQTNEMLAKVSPFVEEADALLVLKDNTVVSGLEVLVKLCNRHQVVLMASDLDSPDRGATFGYGVYEIDFGIHAAHKALKILCDAVHPGTIPVTPVADFTLRINHAAALKQGIALP